MVKPSTNIIIIFLDFTAAFDTICHQHILRKLESQYGISGNVLKWYESFLTDRICHVKIDNELSEGKRCKFGAPQGSVLGPT